MGRRLTIDLEGDGLLHQLTVFHNLGIKDYDTEEKFMFTSRDGNIDEGVAMVEEAEVIIGHNVLGYDLKAIEKLYPDFMYEGKVRDTLIISRLLWSNRADLDMKLVRYGTLEGRHMGRHGLESWGDRLGYPKGDFSQWCEDRELNPWEEFPWEGEFVFEGRTIKKKDHEDRIIDAGVWLWSEIYDMRTAYCEQDVDVAERLFDFELDTMDSWGMADFSVYLEHRFEELMGFCQSDGFPLNKEKAEALEIDIQEHLTDFNEQCAEAFPAEYVPQDGLMFMQDVCNKRDVLNDKQDARVLAAHQKGKTIKTNDYRLLDEFIQFLEDEEVEELPAVTVAARSSTVTHKFPDGTSMKCFIEAGTVKTKIEYKEFNPNSRKQIVAKLMDLGWEPEVYTDAGNPSTKGDILEEAAAIIPICTPIAGGLKCTKIKGYIRSKEGAKAQNGWLNVLSKEGKIHSRTVHIGATTHRVAISKPNIGQIPAIDEYPKDHEKAGEYIMGFEGGWGYECRECFEAPEGWTLMGTDLKGIEVRLLAEEMSEFDNGEYIDVVLDGDIHAKNQEAADLPTRGDAKTFLYSCVTMDTTILTDEGWKSYEEIEIGDLALTYNQKDKVKEWKPILDKVYYPDAEVIEMSHSQSFKVKTTPNHRWFVNKRRRSGDSRRPYMTEKVETTYEINTESNIINNAPMRDNRNLEDYSFDRINNRPKYEVNWIDEIMKMSIPQMNSFLVGFMLADGNYQYGHAAKSNGHWKWSQNTGNIQEAALLATYLCHDGRVHVSTRNDTPSQMKVAHLNNKGHTTGQKLKKITLENQPVWCVKTENESFVMRQGDCITITGNTIYGIGNLALGGRLNPKLNQGDKTKLGKSSKKKFFKAIPAAKKCIKKFEKESKNGYITGVDGRRVPVDSGHKALNYRLQNAAAIIAKLWTIYVYDALLDEDFEAGYDGDFVIAAFVHDELQIPCRTEEIAIRAGEIALEQALIVGEFFGIGIPIEASYKIGKSWAETH